MLKSNNDAFPVDEEQNGLTDTDKIKIIICYLLSEIDFALKRETIQEMLYENKIANYFEVSNAIDSLLETGNVDVVDGKIAVTQKGKTVAKNLKTDISTYYRSRAVAVAQKAMIIQKRKDENKFEISKLGEKKYKINIKMYSSGENEEKENMLDLSLYVSDYSLSELMKLNFYNNPDRLIENIIDALTSDATFKE